MAASFVGLPVLIQLRSGGTAKGTVKSVDGSAGTIILSEAQITTEDGTRIERERVFGRNEVAGLELLAVKKTAQAPSTPRQPAQPSVSQQQEPRQLKPWQAEDGDFEQQSVSSPAQRFPPAVQGYAYSPHPSPSPQSSPKPGTPRSRGQRGARGNNRRGRSQADWDDVEGGDEADMRVSGHQQTRKNQYQQGATNNGEAFDEEFDFNAGLQSFDKSAVFAHIRSTDNIDPSLRLVAHNRKDSSRTPQSKLLPSESVLTVEELEAQQLDRKVALEEAAVPKQQAKRGMTVEELEAGIASVGLEQEQDRGYEYPNEQSGTLMTETGIVVPSVKARQWREALNIADIETSPSPAQRLEYAAYQLSTFILSHLALKFGLFPIPSPPQCRPAVLLICTDCEKSNVALRAGIILANRGCRVVALVEDGKTEDLKTNLRVLSSSGGRIVRELADLPPTFNLVIDALTDSEVSASPSLSSSLSATSPASPALGAASNSEFAIEAARWVNRLEAGVITLSIDVPFGISHDQGIPITPAFLTPTFIFSRALPRPGAVALLSNLEVSPQLFVADVGFAPSIWERIGVDDFEVGLWGAEGIVRVSIDGRS
ncbi:hypothetical protein JCM16303_006349 [Sporobolomyces ruberrimus]